MEKYLLLVLSKNVVNNDVMNGRLTSKEKLNSIHRIFMLQMSCTIDLAV